MTFFGPDIRNGLPIGLGSMAGFGRRAFTPSVLFAAGEQGFWYDPSDLSSMYQDSAGTTPVTAVEQAVGLVLDKSKGLVIGPELVTNGDFSSGTTGWTPNNCTQAVVSGELELTVTGASEIGSSQPITCVVGRTYQVKLVMRSASGNSVANACRVRISTLPTGGGISYIQAITSENTNTNVNAVFVATATTHYIQLNVASLVAWGGVGNKAYFDNVSVRELAGNHAIQPGATNRPILRSRYNLLTYSEDFSNAAWVKAAGGGGSAPVVTPNDAVAPDGTTTADKIVFAAPISGDQSQIYSTPSSPAGALTGYISVKAVAAGDVGKVIGFRHVANGSYTLVTLTADWQRVSVTETRAGDNFELILRPAVSTSSGTVSVYVWGADLRRANDTYLPYQRIAAATDYDTVGFPVYLAFDGSDDSLYTGGNVDFSATDKMTVWAGVTKLADAALGFVAELSASFNANDGVFWLINGDGSVAAGPIWQFANKGTVSALATSPSSYASPITNVLTGVGDIGADVVQLRVDGAQIASTSTDQGTGNYGNYPLYIGRRNNASFPFNGRLYQLIGRGAATSAALITQADRWVAGKQGRAL